MGLAAATRRACENTVTQAINSEIGGIFKAQVRHPITNGAGQTMIPQGAELVGV